MKSCRGSTRSSKFYLPLLDWFYLVLFLEHTSEFGDVEVYRWKDGSEGFGHAALVVHFYSCGSLLMIHEERLGERGRREGRGEIEREVKEKTRQ